MLQRTQRRLNSLCLYFGFSTPPLPPLSLSVYLSRSPSGSISPIHSNLGQMELHDDFQPNICSHLTAAKLRHVNPVIMGLFLFHFLIQFYLFGGECQQHYNSYYI